MTKVTELAASLWVSGIPKYVGAAIPEVIPGTISTEIPFFSKIDTSSPPLEKTNGSPPLSLTTFLPSFANFKIRALVSA